MHYYQKLIIQTSVPPIWKHDPTQFSIFKRPLCQKVRPILKSLWKKLSDSNLKLRKIKLELFLDWILRKMSNSTKKSAPEEFYNLIKHGSDFGIVDQGLLEFL